MRISILERDLPRNSLRDFTLDPIDAERVETLKDSMGAFGNWGGMVARNTPTGPEMIAGEHRRQAELERGTSHADIFIGNFTDDEALRIYATENASQRGNTATAVLGSVGSALRICLREAFTGDIRTGETSRANTGGQRRDGIGWRQILAKLQGVPGITEYLVKNQLANLKASGEYDRITAEVIAEAEARQAAAAAAAQQAEEEARERAAAEERRRAAAEQRRVAAAAAAAAAEERRRQAAAEAEAAAAAAERRAAVEREAEARRQAEAATRREEIARREAEARATAAAEAEAEATVAATQRTTATTNRTRLTTQRQRATQAAERRPQEFDMRVATVFENPAHVQVFRELVTGAELRRVVAVDKQLILAKAIVEKCRADRAAIEAQGGNMIGRLNEFELTGGYIERNIFELAAVPLYLTHLASAAERREAEEALRKAGWDRRFSHYEERVAHATRDLETATGNLAAMLSREAPPAGSGVSSPKINFALIKLHDVVTRLESFGFHQQAQDGQSSNITNQNLIGRGIVIDNETRPAN